MSGADRGGFYEGDRVEVGSLWVVKPSRHRTARHATGHVGEFTEFGVIVDFDCGPVNGVTWCTASVTELTRITEAGE